MIDHDISIIRPQMRVEDFGMRGQDMPKKRLQSVKKGLRLLHTLEGMATNIYKFQITKEKSELNKQLIIAMCNEMTHWQDFQVKLYEYGFKPSLRRWFKWVGGMAIGRVSRFLGPRSILKANVWLETKAVTGYAEILASVEWDDATRKVIEKDQADEVGHINRWKKLLQETS